ncbi:MAG: cell division protein FtsK, partial [Mammaliicoccus vitulinus]
AFDVAQSKTKSKMTHLEKKREEKARTKQLEKEQRQKEQQKEAPKEQLRKEQPKDVSHLKEIEPAKEVSTVETESVNEEIPIFESQEKLAAKRKQQPKQPTQSTQTTETVENENNESTIDETENLNYKLPSLD